MASGAERAKRYRARQNDGEVVVPTPLSREQIEIALNAGFLTDEESRDRKALGKFSAHCVALVTDQWREHFPSRVTPPDKSRR